MRWRSWRLSAVERFDSPQRLVSYLGLNPSVRQSGPGPAHHGRITKQGRGHARGMLVEAAWAAPRVPGPLRAFFQRVRARRGQHVAAVATARTRDDRRRLEAIVHRPRGASVRVAPLAPSVAVDGFSAVSLKVLSVSL